MRRQFPYSYQPPGNTLLYQPDFSSPSNPIDPATLYPLTQAQTNTGLVPGHTFHTAEQPFVRGVKQNQRTRILASSAVPGLDTDPYKPLYAMYVEIQSLHQPTDFTVTATQADPLGTATTIYVSPSDAALLQFNAGAVQFGGDFITNQNNVSTGNVNNEHIQLTAAPNTSTGALSVVRGVDGAANPISVGDQLLCNTGDINPTGKQFRNRNEVYDRFPGPPLSGSSAATLWPDPIGTVRWWGYGIYIPSTNDYSSAAFSVTNQGPWLYFNQFKGQFLGSPPRAMGLEVPGDGTIQFMMAHDGAPFWTGTGNIARDQWHYIVVGMQLGMTKTTGWVQIYIDGVQVVAQTAGTTMDKQANGSVDPTFFKTGCYRNNAWLATHIYYFGPVKVGQSHADVLP